MAERCAVYTRVSTDEQATADHASLAVQEARCRQHVAQQGWSLVAVEQDVESGRAPTRRGYQRVLELARAGAVDTVVVFRADRWGRNAGELLTRADELRRCNVSLVSVSEDISSFLMLGLHAVLADNEWRVILSRTMPSKRAKSEQGYWLAHAPFGTVNERGVLKPGPHFELVQLAFQLCADGVAVAEIVRRLNAASETTVRYHRIIKTLRNELYVSVVRWGGVQARAKWEPLIDPDVFARAQVQIRKRYVERRHLSRSYPYWILGLAFCGHCGHRMTAKVHRSKWGQGTYPYIVCGSRDDAHMARRCRGPYVNIVHLQDWLVTQLAARRCDRESVERHVAELTAGDDARRDAAGKRAQSLRRERGRLEVRVNAAKTAHLDAPDTFTLADVRRVIAATVERTETIDRELAASPVYVPDIDVDDVRRFFLEDGWLDARDAAPQEFRAFLQRFISRIVVAGPGRYEVEWRHADILTPAFT